MKTGKPFVRYWIHNNLVTVNGQKMSKSLGNVILLKDAFKKWRPEVIRFFILQSHYRSTLDFSNEAIDGAAKGLERLVNTIRNVQERQRQAPEAGTQLEMEKFKSDFLLAMDDDFNTPQAIAILFDMSRDVNQFLNTNAQPGKGSLQQVLDLFQELGFVLGLDLLAAAPSHGAGAGLDGKLMELVIGLRQEIRAQKLWSFSDRIRDGLAGLGIALEDKKDGTSWKRVE